MKILILKPSSLGDVIQALPVLRLLKLHFRTRKFSGGLIPRSRRCSKAIPIWPASSASSAGAGAHPQNWPEMFRSIRWLRAQKFDLVIDLQCLLRSGVFAWLANGKFLIGLDEAREGARGFYDVAVPRKSFHTHAVDWYLPVLPALGVPVHNNFHWLPRAPANRRRSKTKMAWQNSIFNRQSAIGIGN